MDGALLTWSPDQSHSRPDDACAVGNRIERTLAVAPGPDLVNNLGC